jgi:hypothetical protein
MFISYIYLISWRTKSAFYVLVAAEMGGRKKNYSNPNPKKHKRMID